MFLRFLTILISAFLITGCVLQSQTPIFTDKNGVAALKPLGETFATWNWVDGAWQSQKDRVKFTAVGKHYEATSDDGEKISVSFVSLAKDTWVMQVIQPEKPAAYLIARRDGNALLLQVPACEVLKKQPTTAKRLRFDGDNCFAPANFSLAEFKSMTKRLPPARLKLETVD